MLKKIELLSPAKNLDYGIAAINCGADAVYIGASAFGARKSAGNSISDISALTEYAHKFNARVYATVNTILFENELDDAEKLIHNMYNIGCDAIIIQDMGILELNLPPIPLFASTQTHNISPEKILFLEKTGIQRAILARELSFSTIAEIRKKTSIELESFIHGAICVSYSGQCYISQYLTGRSGNRGECAQICRTPFDLTNEKGQILIENKHLLSIKDLNLSSHISKLIDSGITSFKVEGRLKDISYVKNITSYYRKLLDKILEDKIGLQKSSSGKLHFLFTPDSEKTFNRGYTNYFINGRKEKISSFLSPKSTGKQIGEISFIGKDFFRIDTDEKLNNGDGLCFYSDTGELKGFRVNKVYEQNIYPDSISGLYCGLTLFRNHDQEFNKKLEGKYAERKISVNILFSCSSYGASIQLTDEDGNAINFTQKIEFQKPENVEKLIQTIKNQLSKTGNTIFEVKDLNVNAENLSFIPAGILNEIRRNAFENLLEARTKNYKQNTFQITPNDFPYPSKTLDYRANVSNSKAIQFYKRHGVETLENAFELDNDNTSKTLMTTKMCLKFELGLCEKYQKPDKSNFIFNELFLKNLKHRFILEFDCEECVMNIKSEKSK